MPKDEASWGPRFPITDLISMKLLPPSGSLPAFSLTLFLEELWKGWGKPVSPQYRHALGIWPLALSNLQPSTYSYELGSMKKKLMHFTPKKLPISSLKGVSFTHIRNFSPERNTWGGCGRNIPHRNAQTTILESEDLSSNPKLPLAKNLAGWSCPVFEDSVWTEEWQYLPFHFLFVSIKQENVWDVRGTQWDSQSLTAWGGVPVVCFDLGTV